MFVVLSRLLLYPADEEDDVDMDIDFDSILEYFEYLKELKGLEDVVRAEATDKSSEEKDDDSQEAAGSKSLSRKRRSVSGKQKTFVCLLFLLCILLPI